MKYKLSKVTPDEITYARVSSDNPSKVSLDTMIDSKGNSSRGVLPLPTDGGARLRFEKWTLRGTENSLKRYPARDWPL